MLTGQVVPLALHEFGRGIVTGARPRRRLPGVSPPKIVQDLARGRFASLRRSAIFEVPSLVLSPETRGNGDTRWNGLFASCLVSWTTRHDDAPEKRGSVIHTIFEGTSEIQQLVISRAISVLRIE